MLLTCPCDHCNGHIQFDIDQFHEIAARAGSPSGLRVPCPHCKVETMVYVPQLGSGKQQVELVDPKKARIHLKLRVRRFPMIGLLLRIMAIPMIIQGSLLLGGYLFGLYEVRHIEQLSPWQKTWALFALISMLPGTLIFTIAGVVVFAIGDRFSWKLVCTSCGNRVADKESSYCPSCRATLAHY